MHTFNRRAHVCSRNSVSFASVTPSSLQQQPRHVCSRNSVMIAATTPSRLQQQLRHVCINNSVTFAVTTPSRLSQRLRYVCSNNSVTFAAITPSPCCNLAPTYPHMWHSCTLTRGNPALDGAVFCSTNSSDSKLVPAGFNFVQCIESNYNRHADDKRALCTHDKIERLSCNHGSLFTEAEPGNA